MTRLPPRPGRWIAILGFGFALWPSSACRQGSDRPEPRAGVPANAQKTPAVHPEYDKTTGQLTRLDYDSDGDGKTDTWGYMDGSRVVRVEVDENGDGTIDRWEYHRNGGEAPTAGGQAGPDKTIERIERATRHDGKVSRWEYFDKGLLVRVEEDTDGDGTIDKWETYTGGTLAVMALDTQHRGTPDRRLVYDASGALLRVETDPHGTGHFEPLPQPAKP
jgi:hypothetical protein